MKNEDLFDFLLTTLLRIGFYRGVGSPLLALTIRNTLNFSSYSLVSKRKVTIVFEDDFGLVTFMIIIAFVIATIKYRTILHN